jgi:hypothetical protein
VSTFDRTRTDRTTTEPAVETPADEADREAYDADRVEARERETVVADRPISPIAAARESFGGIDLPASLVGMLTGLAMVVLLGGLVGAAVGAIGYQTGLRGDNVDDISTASLVGGLVVLFVSYVIGGWAAGRIARYDGARNGVMAAVWTIVLAGALSALAAWFGDKYDVFSNVELPQWFNRDAFTTTALVSGVAAIGAMLVGGALGGLWGTRYHRRADQTLLEARELREVEVP